MTRDDYVDLYLSEMDLGPRWCLRETRGAWAPGAAEVAADRRDPELLGELDKASLPMHLPASAAAKPAVPSALAAAPANARTARPAASPVARSEAKPVSSRPSGLPQNGSPVGDVQTLDWAALENAIHTCNACGLCRQRRQAVPGVGDQQADWLLIGEGPGQEEDAQGEPFVGPVGKLLDNMLLAIGLRRGENVYISNAVKCRPPNNRTPEAVEIETCKPYLERQIALLQPKLIVLLGRVAARSVLGSEEQLGSLRGRIHRYRDIPVVVTYHPAYLHRTLHDKAKAWEDLCLARQTMRHLPD